MTDEKPLRTTSRRNRWTVALGCFGLAVLVVASAVVAVVRLTALPPLEADTRVLPNPNGFDAVKASVLRLTPGAANSVLLSKTASPAAIREALRNELPELERLHLALQLPYMTPALTANQALIDPTNGIGAPLRDGARKLVAKSRMLAGENRPSEAMECALDAVALGVKAGRGGTIIDVLVGNACLALGAGQALSLIDRQAPESLSRSRRRLRSLLAEAAGEQDVLAEERRVARLTTLRFGGNPMSRLMIFQIDAVYKEAIAECSKPSVERRPTPSASSMYGSLVATVIPDLRKSLDKRDRLLQTLYLKLAVEEYRKTRHRLPDSFDALVPEILAAPPIDLLTQKPWKYRRLGDAFEIAPG